MVAIAGLVGSCANSPKTPSSAHAPFVGVWKASVDPQPVYFSVGPSGIAALTPGGLELGPSASFGQLKVADGKLEIADVFPDARFHATYSFRGDTLVLKDGARPVEFKREPTPPPDILVPTNVTLEGVWETTVGDKTATVTFQSGKIAFSENFGDIGGVTGHAPQRTPTLMKRGHIIIFSKQIVGGTIPYKMEPSGKMHWGEQFDMTFTKRPAPH